ncbi:MAG: CoA transferase [Pseudomonadota bacterium]
MSMLREVRVLELGRRTACQATGALLAEFGADVYTPDAPDLSAPGALALMAGKQWLAADTFAAMQAGPGGYFDIVLHSSDEACTTEPVTFLRDGGVEVDIVAAGRPLSDEFNSILSDAAAQAVTGMMATTGMADGPPVLQDGEPLELIAALHALAGALAALYARGSPPPGRRERVAVSLTDCSMSSHAVFVSRLIAEPTARAHRSGNRHQLASPWNVFQTRDGWLLICMAQESQWQRFCEVAGRPEQAEVEGFRNGTERQANIEAVEAFVQGWVRTRDSADVSAALSGIGVPCGPVAPIGAHPEEPNLTHRDSVRAIESGDGQESFMPGPLLHATRDPGRTRGAPRPASDTRALAARHASPAKASSTAPLSGVNVIELGQFTTAPVATRYLANLGARVTKIEAPGGEVMRGWAPQRHGIGLFYVVNNSGKHGLTLDLKSTEGRAQLEQILTNADVLVENLKPGALARMGFDEARLAALNPKLIYCAVTGFGADSIYPGRPAYDTVVQAMSGLMHATRADGLPVKTGMSSADVMGANFAVAAVIGALIARRRHGHGQFIDVSMQDIAAWCTQRVWNHAETVYTQTSVVPCADGHVLVLTAKPDSALLARAPSSSRDALTAQWPGLVWPVRSFTETMASAYGQSQVIEVPDAGGQCWPALRNPIQMRDREIVHLAVLNP